MKIIVAPDSFKGNMSAMEVCKALEEGILMIDPGILVRRIPLADGGEGTARAVTEAAGGSFVQTSLSGPLGTKHKAEFGLINGGKTAVLDMASASGIELVPRHLLNPMKASSYGTGELIRAAMDSGAKELIIGIGGSATVDGGVGMMQALGYKVLDKEGSSVPRGGEGLALIEHIDTSGADPRLKDVVIKVACDVTNPLLGSYGAAVIFGPQKGADPAMVRQLETGLEKLAAAWIREGMARDVNQPGDGAAGGIGAALRICTGASMESGAKLVIQYTGFMEELKDADLVITGEGMTDAQTAGGKLCSVVAQTSRKNCVPVALLSGGLGGDVSSLLLSFDYAVSISCGQTSLDAMIQDSRRDLVFAAANLVRAIKLCTVSQDC